MLEAFWRSFRQARGPRGRNELDGTLRQAQGTDGRMVVVGGDGRFEFGIFDEIE